MPAPIKKPARCEHVKVNGIRCGSPALRGRRLCYYHFNCRLNQIHPVPILEDGNAIQLGVQETIRAVLDGRIETKRAGLVLYGLQIAAMNLRRVENAPRRRRMVIKEFGELRYPYLDDADRAAPSEPQKAEPAKGPEDPQD